MKALNAPVPALVEANPEGNPVFIDMQPVDRAQDTWTIADEWWHPNPIDREYWDLILQYGASVTVFRDVATGNWFRQRY